MKPLITIFIAFCTLSSVAYADELQFKNCGERWTPHQIPADLVGASFTADAEAIINLDEQSEGPLATVQVHAFSVPINVKLGGNTVIWRKAILLSPPASSKFSVINERTYLVTWSVAVHYRI